MPNAMPNAMTNAMPSGNGPNVVGESPQILMEKNMKMERNAANQQRPPMATRDSNPKPLPPRGPPKPATNSRLARNQA